MLPLVPPRLGHEEHDGGGVRVPRCQFTIFLPPAVEVISIPFILVINLNVVVAMLSMITKTALTTSTLLLMSHPNRGFLAPKWVTHHFWEIHICGAAPLSINAILPICEGLVAARMTLCAVVNTSHPHIPETHQESRMKAFVG